MIATYVVSPGQARHPSARLLRCRLGAAAPRVPAVTVAFNADALDAIQCVAFTPDHDVVCLGIQRIPDQLDNGLDRPVAARYDVNSKGNTRCFRPARPAIQRRTGRASCFRPGLKTMPCSSSDRRQARGCQINCRWRAATTTATSPETLLPPGPRRPILFTDDDKLAA